MIEDHNKHCKICNKTRDLFSLELQVEDAEDEKYTVFVCGSCWDIIAQIARFIAQQEIDKDKEKLCNGKG